MSRSGLLLNITRLQLYLVGVRKCVDVPRTPLRFLPRRGFFVAREHVTSEQNSTEVNTWKGRWKFQYGSSALTLYTRASQVLSYQEPCTKSWSVSTRHHSAVHVKSDSRNQSRQEAPATRSQQSRKSNAKHNEQSHVKRIYIYT